MRGRWKRGRVGRVRHCQPKGTATAGPDLHDRASALLYCGGRWPKVSGRFTDRHWSERASPRLLVLWLPHRGHLLPTSTAWCVDAVAPATRSGPHPANGNPSGDRPPRCHTPRARSRSPRGPDRTNHGTVGKTGDFRLDLVRSVARDAARDRKALGEKRGKKRDGRLDNGKRAGRTGIGARNLAHG